MVNIHVKHAKEDDEFLLHECPSTSSIQDISRHIAQICNLRSRIQSLAHGVGQLLLHPNGDENGLLALRRAVSEAQGYASKDQVLYKKVMQVEILKDHIKDIEKELKSLAAFTDSDILPLLHSSNSTGIEPFHPSRIQLWWASKELLKSKRLCDYIGKNEKTKIVVRLQLSDLDKGQSSVN